MLHKEIRNQKQFVWNSLLGHYTGYCHLIGKKWATFLETILAKLAIIIGQQKCDHKITIFLIC